MLVQHTSSEYCHPPLAFSEWLCYFPQPQGSWCCCKRCSLFCQSRIRLLIKCFSQLGDAVQWRRQVRVSLTSVMLFFIDLFYFFCAKICMKPEPRLFFTQLLSTASRGQEISIIHEDGLFLHMKLLLDTNWSFSFVFTTSIFITPSNLNICMFCDVQFAIKYFKPIFFFLVIILSCQ